MDVTSATDSGHRQHTLEAQYSYKLERHFRAQKRELAMEGTCERTLEGHTRTVCALALGHDGTTLYSGSVDNTESEFERD